MYEIINEASIRTKERIVIAYNEHRVPGLRDFCYQNSTVALIPDPWHCHSDIIEIICMVKGERVSYVETDNGTTQHIIHGNEIFITYPYEAHRNGDSSQTPAEFYGFQINLQDRDHLLCLNKEYSNSLCERLFSLKSRHLQLSGTELSLVRTAFNLFADGNAQDVESGILSLSTFLFGLQYMNPVGEACQGQGQQDEQIQRVLKYIDNNIQKPLNLAELAQVSGYSLSRFKSRFKEIVGIPPAEFVTQQKIKFAKRMLESTDMSVTAVAYELGFSSSNYFSSVFKKILYITPLEYRKKYAAEAASLPLQ